MHALLTSQRRHIAGPEELEHLHANIQSANYVSADMQQNVVWSHEIGFLLGNGGELEDSQV